MNLSSTHTHTLKTNAREFSSNWIMIGTRRTMLHFTFFFVFVSCAILFDSSTITPAETTMVNQMETNMAVLTRAGT